MRIPILHILPASALPAGAPPAVRALTWLIGALALAVAPQVLYLPVWVSALAFAAGGWRLLAARRAWPLPGKWTRVVLAFAGLSGVYLQFGTVLGRDAGTALLVVMTALKLLEAKTRRECVLLLFLGYFLIIATFLYVQSIAAALYLFAAVLALTGALIHLNKAADASSARASLRLAGVMLVQAMPFMLALFVLFPRVSGSLWGMEQSARGARSGLSEEMTPGAFSALAQSQDVAFRAAFSGPLPAPRERYWRGPVFWHTDGRTWSPGHGAATPPALQASGAALSYSITLEPHQKTWLFALDLPANIPPDATLSGDFQLRANAPVERRIRYEMRSYPNYQTGAPSAAELRRALQLPSDANPRTRALATSWRMELAELNDDAKLVQHALAYFNQQPFFYTLTPPLLGVAAGDHPVDEFLFDTRRGFCEHYSAAFATLMRAAGVPARVVTGYQGGELNPIGGYLTVRQSDAHAWTEVWLAGRGWVRVDPTGAVAPQRIERGVAAALDAAVAGDADFAVQNGLWRRAWLQARFRWDAVNYRWGQWVLGYNAARQRQLLSQFGLDALVERGAAALGLALVALLAVLFAAFSLQLLRNRPAHDAALKLYRRFCAKLARRGVVRAPHEGPMDFAARAAAALPQCEQEIIFISRLYCTLRYAAHQPAHAYAQLNNRVNEFKL
ncbi:MAG: DUF3488 and transglutaminase-like domain-containing protein [Pseudomonadota bacterium]